MADTPLETMPPLHLIDAETDGYCDTVTGVCAVPSAARYGTAVPDTGGDATCESTED
ncbi:hypothetical protein [Streptomyces sp. NPDC056672]|uniref:hypothetical protein n=1 Tax=Streptomyces sp. NPDC056672 TaxID=3345906 RepID=UPI003697BD1C